jgi:pimeloyl-ACP methyl ester carboxylesterase
VNDLSLDAYLEPLMRDMRGTLRTLQHMSVASEPTPIDAVLAGIRAPVVVLVGERPTPSSPTPEQLSLLRRVLPRARVDTVPGVGAMLHEEAPSAVVAAIVDAAVPTCPCDEASAAYVGSTLAAGRRQRE